jgi:pilus assembly protein Flp/PilA
MSKLAERTSIAAKRFLADERGATAIEYCMIAAGVAGVIVTAITTLGGTIGDMWTSVKSALGS